MLDWEKYIWSIQSCCKHQLISRWIRWRCVAGRTEFIWPSHCGDSLCLWPWNNKKQKIWTGFEPADDQMNCSSWVTAVEVKLIRNQLNKRWWCGYRCYTSGSKSRRRRNRNIRNGFSRISPPSVCCCTSVVVFVESNPPVFVLSVSCLLMTLESGLSACSDAVLGLYNPTPPYRASFRS